jgi:alkanesulfonate monooxygenase SsuD/methylene tetrahydromethanopterin reductase-like flavin-dependent oxidoreductase (luciferase family)
MRLATEIPWMSRRFEIPMERIKLTEQLGFDAVFTAEGTGSDALTPLGYVAAVTDRLKLGTHVASVTARPPTVLAQAFQTLDAMAGGDRIIVGLGNSLPSYCEGWHGQAWGRPVRRMRDYIDVMEQVFRGEGPHDIDGNEIETSELIWEHSRSRLRDPVSMQSSELSIPYSGNGARGMQPWVSLLESGPTTPPFVLAAIGPQMIALAAELADGWFPMGFAPGMMRAIEPLLQAGFDRAGNGKGIDDFDIWAIVDMLVTDDVREGFDLFREYVVEYAELLRNQMEVLGYPGLCDRLGELVASGRRAEALAEVPDDYVDHSFLIGPLQRIAHRLEPWLESGASGLIFRYGPQVRVGKGNPAEDLRVYEVIADVAR